MSISDFCSESLYLWNKEILKWGKRKVELSSEHSILLLKSSIESNQNILNQEPPNPETLKSDHVSNIQKKPHKYEYNIVELGSNTILGGLTHKVFTSRSMFYHLLAYLLIAA